jgi:hypothetical protein
MAVTGMAIVVSRGMVATAMAMIFVSGIGVGLREQRRGDGCGR